MSASLDITEDFHIWPATTTNRKQLNTSHLLLMVISLAQKFLSCAKFRPLRVIKKDVILLTLDWLWGRPQTLLQRRNVSSVRFGLANGTKRTPSQNWGTYNQSCMYPSSSAWPAFLTPFLLLLPVSGHLSRGFTVPPTKRAYSALRSQSRGFPKIVY